MVNIWTGIYGRFSNMGNEPFELNYNLNYILNISLGGLFSTHSDILKMVVPLIILRLSKGFFIILISQFKSFSHNSHWSKYSRFRQFPSSNYCLSILYALSKPLVDESCVVTSASFSNSGKILFANCLPSSTPHWSKL